MTYISRNSNVGLLSNQNMNIVANIVILIVLILIVVGIYYFVKWLTNPTSKQNVLLSSITSTKTLYTINSNLAPITSNGIQMTYSMWIYINNWDYNYGTAKHVMHRGDIQLKYASPNIWLYPSENKLMIRFAVKNSLDNNLSSVNYPMSSSNNPKFNPEILNESFVCDLPYVPIQKWMNLVVSLNNNVSDVYVDGKLIRSCVLQGIPHIKYADNSTNNIYVGGDNKNSPQMPGFDGYVSNLMFKNDAITYPEVAALYNAGPVDPVSTIDKMTNYFRLMYNKILGTSYKCNASTNVGDNTITIKSGKDVQTYKISN